jgi:transposase
MKGSFLVSDKVVNLRWFKEDPELRTTGSIIGGDQGFKTCLTLSDEQITKPQPTPNPNKFHDLESILRDMRRKKKGSRAFKKLQVLRKNYIHWSLHQLNLSGVKEVRFEKIWNIGYKKRTSKLMSHWTNTIIRDGWQDFCLRNGVRFIEVESAYKSQRCCECGLVKKSNRKKKVYKCPCGHVMDADLNSSKNQPLDLPEISYEFRKLKLNIKGFYWLESGIFDLNGVEIRVPLVPSIKQSNC